MHGHHLCVAHATNRFPVCPKGSRVAIPLLEDLDTIQVVATQVAQGLFADSLDPLRAGKILYACQIAALTIPRPARLPPVEKLPLAPQPATDLFPSPDGAFLGPSLAWSADQLGSRPAWSYHKLLYERECERLGKPRPAGPDDLPAAGWLTPEEAEEYCKRPEILAESFWERTLRLRIEADQRGELPPLRERTCCYVTYRDPDCEGPGSDHPCEFCYREREEHLRLPPREQTAPANHPSPDSGPTTLTNLQATAAPRPPATPPPSLDELLDPLHHDPAASDVSFMSGSAHAMLMQVPHAMHAKPARSPALFCPNTSRLPRKQTRQPPKRSPVQQFFCPGQRNNPLLSISTTKKHPCFQQLATPHTQGGGGSASNYGGTLADSFLASRFFADC